MKRFRSELLFDSAELISADFDWFANIVHYGTEVLSALSGKVIVVKLGGKRTLQKESIGFVCADLLLLSRFGAKVVVVHGGGGELTKEMEKFDLAPSVIQEYTPIPAKMLENAQMVLRGKIAPLISSALQLLGLPSICLSGTDCNLVTVERARPIVKDSAPNVRQILDLGMVGEPTSFKASFLTKLLDCMTVPILSPIGFDSKGAIHIMNADTCAGFIAKELQAEKLIILCDYEGLANAGGESIAVLSASECEHMLRFGLFHEKSVHKARIALSALFGGCGSVHIASGHISHPVLRNLFNQTDSTTIYS